LIYLLSQSKKEGVVSLPIIKSIRVAANINFNTCDTLIFTSKNCVDMVNSIDKRWKEYDIISIGEATTRKIEELGGNVIFSSKGYGDSLVQDIIHNFFNKKILFLRPKKVATDIRLKLKNYGIAIDEQVIYETQCIAYDSTKIPPAGSIIIFTSPSTVKCFFDNFVWHESYKAVAIGEVTAKAFPRSVDYVIAHKPLIDSCIKEAQKLEK
jgi:uroporphyrinogen-III synthase